MVVVEDGEVVAGLGGHPDEVADGEFVAMSTLTKESLLMSI